jgi:hypothetical protein
MENIRNYKTNCKVNLVNFYCFQHENQSRNYKYKPACY